MNTIPTPDAARAPVDHHALITPIMSHLGEIHRLMREAGLRPELSHLIELRVSQINGCAFCVRMHAADARRDGETDARLDHLAAWRHMDDYSAAEKAAFNWAESLTDLSRYSERGELRAELRRHFTERQIALITTCVGLINMWNRVQASND